MADATRPRTIVLPLPDAPWATLSARFPLSPGAWERLMALLAEMKPGLVAPAPEAIAPDASAGAVSPHPSG